MVPILARDSIILKCRQKQNRILGNYECAYALGLMSKLSGISLMGEHRDMREVLKDFLEKAKSYAPASDEEKKLLKMLLNFQPEELVDEQMEEMIAWGKKEDSPWTL